MSSAFTSIKQGLDEAIEYSSGRVRKANVHEFGPVEVKKIRSELGMSQNEFARRAGLVSSRCLRMPDRSHYGVAR